MAKKNLKNKISTFILLDMKTHHKDVKIFYEEWNRFQSQLEFWEKMKYELSEAPNRQLDQ